MKFFTQWQQRRTLFKAADILISADAGLGLMHIFVVAMSDVKRIHPSRLEFALFTWELAWLELSTKRIFLANPRTPFSIALFELVSPVFEPHQDAIQSILDDLTVAMNQYDGTGGVDEPVEANPFISRIDTAIQSAQETLRSLFAELDLFADELGLPLRYRANRKKASRYFEKGFGEIWAD